LDRLQGSLIEDTPLPPSNSSSINSNNSNDNGEGVMAPEGEPLNSFWRRYNQSLLGKVAFQERRDALLEENRMLQVSKRREKKCNRHHFCPYARPRLSTIYLRRKLTYFLFLILISQ